jgi:hypothetical protein
MTAAPGALLALRGGLEPGVPRHRTFRGTGERGKNARQSVIGCPGKASKGAF